MFTIVPPDIVWALSVDSRPNIPASHINITIPAGLGIIKDSWSSRTPQTRKPDNSQTIIHIQDAHCNYYAQTRIAEIIKYLSDNYDVNTINLEGGAKDYDLSLFTGIQDKAAREKAADHFVREGILNGAEYFAANNPEKVSLWGIEDTKLYIENLRVYRDSLTYKDDIEKSLKTLNYSLANLKAKIYSKELLELDRKANVYKEKSVEFKNYVAYLINLSKSQGINISGLENINILNKTISLEPGIDFKKANVERDELVDRLTKLLSRIEVKELVEKAVEFKLGRLTPVEFYSYLITKSKELRLNLDEYKSLVLYIGYTQLYSTIKNDQLFKELDTLEEGIREKLYQNPIQKELHKLSKNLVIIKNIFGITLTPDEYRYYKGHQDEFRMENYVKFVNKQAPLSGLNFRLDDDVLKLNDYLEKIEKFYIVSLRRDGAFLKNLKFNRGRLNVPYSVDNSKTAILITGGFHSENLAELFKKNNISYISVMPNFKNEDGYVCPYFKLLSGEKKIVLAEEVQKLTGQALAYYSPNTPLAKEVVKAVPAVSQDIGSAIDKLSPALPDNADHQNIKRISITSLCRLEKIWTEVTALPKTFIALGIPFTLFGLFMNSPLMIANGLLVLNLGLTVNKFWFGRIYSYKHMSLSSQKAFIRSYGLLTLENIIAAAILLPIACYNLVNIGLEIYNIPNTMFFVFIVGEYIHNFVYQINGSTLSKRDDLTSNITSLLIGQKAYFGRPFKGAIGTHLNKLRRRLNDKKVSVPPSATGAATLPQNIIEECQNILGEGPSAVLTEDKFRTIISLKVSGLGHEIFRAAQNVARENLHRVANLPDSEDRFIGALKIYFQAKYEKGSIASNVLAQPIIQEWALSQDHQQDRYMRLVRLEISLGKSDLTGVITEMVRQDKGLAMLDITSAFNLDTTGITLPHSERSMPEMSSTDFEKRAKKTGPFYNMLLYKENLSRLLELLSVYRLVYPWNSEPHSSRAPLRYAIDNELYFCLDRENGIYVAPTTESFRRFIIFTMDSNKNVEEMIELKIPGQDIKKRTVWPENFTVSERLRNLYGENVVCPAPLALLRLDREALNLYGKRTIFNGSAKVMVYAYENDGKRLDNYFWAIAERKIEHPGKETLKVLADKCMQRIAEFHAAGYAGGSDMLPSNFRIIKRGTALDIIFAGDFEDCEELSDKTAAKRGRMTDEDVMSMAIQLRDLVKGVGVSDITTDSLCEKYLGYYAVASEKVAAAKQAGAATPPATNPNAPLAAKGESSTLRKLFTIAFIFASLVFGNAAVAGIMAMAWLGHSPQGTNPTVPIIDYSIERRSPKKFASIAVKILETYKNAYKNGRVHGNISIGNIRIVPGTEEIVILDNNTEAGDPLIKYVNLRKILYTSPDRKEREKADSAGKNITLPRDDVYALCMALIILFDNKTTYIFPSRERSYLAYRIDGNIELVIRKSQNEFRNLAEILNYYRIRSNKHDVLDELIQSLSRAAGLSSSTLRVPKAVRNDSNDYFGIERERYLSQISLSALPCDLARFYHAFPWPVDMGNPKCHISNFCGVQHYQYPDKAHFIHSGIDIQTDSGAEIRAVEDGVIVYIERFDMQPRIRLPLQKVWPISAYNFVDVWVYSKESGILWFYTHLDKGSIPRSAFALSNNFNRSSSVKIKAGELIGRVKEWHTKEALKRDVEIPPTVLKEFGRSYNHLHLEAKFVGKVLQDKAQEVTAPILDPLQLMVPLYDLHDAYSGNIYRRDSTTLALAGPVVSVVGHLLVETSPALGIALEILALAATLGFITYITHRLIAKYRNAKQGSVPPSSGAGAATPPAAKDINLSINRILPSDVNDAVIRELAAIEGQAFSDNPALILGTERISTSLLSQGGINIVAKDASGSAVGYMLSQPENSETLYGTDLAILSAYQDKPAAVMLRIFRSFTKEATRAGYRYLAFHARRVSGISEFFRRIGAEKVGEEENRWKSGETFDIYRLDLFKLPSSFVMLEKKGGDITTYVQAAPLIAVVLGVIAGSPILITIGIAMPYVPMVYKTIRQAIGRWKNTDSPYIFAQISLYSITMAFFGGLFYSSAKLSLATLSYGDPTYITPIILISGYVLSVVVISAAIINISLYLLKTAWGGAKGVVSFLRKNLEKSERAARPENAGPAFNRRSLLRWGAAGAAIAVLNEAERMLQFAASADDRLAMIENLEQTHVMNLKFVSQERLNKLGIERGIAPNTAAGFTSFDGKEIYIASPALSGNMEMSLAEFIKFIMESRSFDEKARVTTIEVACHEAYHAVMAREYKRQEVETERGKKRQQNMFERLLRSVTRTKDELDFEIIGKSFCKSVFGMDINSERALRKLSQENTQMKLLVALKDCLQNGSYSNSIVIWEEACAFIFGTLVSGRGLLSRPEAEQHVALDNYETVINDSTLASGPHPKIDYKHRLAELFIVSIILSRDPRQFKGLRNYYKELGLGLPIAPLIQKRTNFYKMEKRSPGRKDPALPALGMAAAWLGAGTEPDGEKGQEAVSGSEDESFILKRPDRRRGDVSGMIFGQKGEDWKKTTMKAASLTRRIMRERRMPTADEINVLSGALKAIFQDGFESGLFNDPDLAEFFKPKQGLAFNRQPVTLWAVRNKEFNNDGRIEKMLKTVCKHNPDITAGVAGICCMIGIAFYNKRTYTSYSRSELFHRLAHEIDAAAKGSDKASLFYLNKWVWSLKHCGRENEALFRREMDKLVELNRKRSTGKGGKVKHLYLVESACADLDKAASEMKKLNLGVISPLSEERFIERTNSAESLIQPVLSIGGTAWARAYPRALSAVAYGYFLLCAINRARLNYLVRRFPQRTDEIREAALNIFDSLRDAVSFASSAYQKSENSDGQKEHAGRILGDIISRAGDIVKAWHDMVVKEKIVFPNNERRLASAFEKINSLAGKMEGSAGLELQACLIPAMNLLKVHSLIPDAVMENLKTCGEADIANADQYFGTITKLANRRLAGQGINGITAGGLISTIESYVDYYREKIPLDKPSLAIIHVYSHILVRPDERTSDAIIDYSDDLADGLDRKEWLERLDRVSNFLKLDIIQPREKEVDTAVKPSVAKKTAPAAGAGDLVKIDDLVLSIGGKSKGKVGLNFVDEVDRLKKDFDLLMEWDGKQGISWNYTGMYRDKLDELRKEFMSYEIATANYIGKYNTMNGRDKQSEGSLLSRNYRKIKEDIAVLRKLLEARHSYIISTIRKVIAAKLAERNVCKEKYRDIDLQRIWEQINIVDLRLGMLNPVLDETSEDYLLLEKFSARLENVDSGLKILHRFGDNLTTFKDLLAVVDRAEKETELYRTLLGEIPFVETFSEAIQNKKEDIFRMAFEGKSMDSLSSADTDFYRGMLQRAEYLAGIRMSIEETFRESDFSDYLLAGRSGRAELEKVTKEVKKIIRDDIIKISQESYPVDIVRYIFNIHTACPAESLAQPHVDRICIHLNRKIVRLFDIAAMGSYAGWENYIRKAEWMQSLVPGVFTSKSKTEVEKLRENSEKLLTEIKSLELGSDQFEHAVERIDNRYGVLKKKAAGLLLASDALWRDKIAGELTIMNKLIIVWLKNWMGDLVDPAQIEDLQKVFGEIEEYTRLPVQGASLERYKANITKLANILSNIDEKCSFFMLVDKLKKSLLDYLHTDYFARTFLNGKALGGKDVRFAAIPVFKDGMLEDIEFMVSAISPDDPTVITAKLFADNIGRNVAPDVEAAMQKIKTIYNADFNSNFFSQKKEYRDISLNPFYFYELIKIVNARYWYLNLSLISETSEAELPRLNSIDLSSVILSCVPFINKRFKEYGSDTSNYTDTVKLMAKLKRLRLLGKKRPLTPPEEEMERKLTYVLKRLRTLGDYDWFEEKNAENFIKSVFKLIGKITGEEPVVSEGAISTGAMDEFRTSLTLEPNASRISSTYPVQRKYRGVYFYPETLSFGVSPADSGDMSEEFASALNQSFLYYIINLEKDGGAKAGSGQPAWRKHLDSTLRHLQKTDGKIDVAVVPNLPANSMLAVRRNTVLFDFQFIQALMSGIPIRAGPRIILGERIMHEFGHIEKEDSVADIPDAYNKIVETEIRQIESDVTLLEKLYRSNRRLPKEVDDFVHEMISPQIAKFSSVFNTARLFTNMNRWVDMYRRGNLNGMRLEIRMFVIKSLKGIEPSPSMRPFANIAAPKNEESPVLSITGCEIPTASDYPTAWTAVDNSDKKWYVKRHINFEDLFYRFAELAGVNVPRSFATHTGKIRIKERDIEEYEWPFSGNTEQRLLATRDIDDIKDTDELASGGSNGLEEILVMFAWLNGRDFGIFHNFESRFVQGAERFFIYDMEGFSPSYADAEYTFDNRFFYRWWKILDPEVFEKTVERIERLDQKMILAIATELGYSRDDKKLQALVEYIDTRNQTLRQTLVKSLESVITNLDNVKYLKFDGNRQKFIGKIRSIIKRISTPKGSPNVTGEVGNENRDSAQLPEEKASDAVPKPAVPGEAPSVLTEEFVRQHTAGELIDHLVETKRYGEEAFIRECLLLKDPVKLAEFEEAIVTAGDWPLSSMEHFGPLYQPSTSNEIEIEDQINKVIHGNPGLVDFVPIIRELIREHGSIDSMIGKKGIELGPLRKLGCLKYLRGCTVDVETVSSDFDGMKGLNAYLHEVNEYNDFFEPADRQGQYDFIYARRAIYAGIAQPAYGPVKNPENFTRTELIAARYIPLNRALKNGGLLVNIYDEGEEEELLTEHEMALLGFENVKRYYVKIPGESLALVLSAMRKKGPPAQSGTVLLSGKVNGPGNATQLKLPPMGGTVGDDIVRQWVEEANKGGEDGAEALAKLVAQIEALADNLRPGTIEHIRALITNPDMRLKFLLAVQTGTLSESSTGSSQDEVPKTGTTLVEGPPTNVAAKTDESGQSPWGGLDMRTLLEYVRDRGWSIDDIANLAKKNIEEGMMTAEVFIDALRSMAASEPQYATRCRDLKEALSPAASADISQKTRPVTKNDAYLASFLLSHVIDTNPRVMLSRRRDGPITEFSSFGIPLLRTNSQTGEIFISPFLKWTDNSLIIDTKIKISGGGYSSEIGQEFRFLIPDDCAHIKKYLQEAYNIEILYSLVEKSSATSLPETVNILTLLMLNERFFIKHVDREGYGLEDCLLLAQTIEKLVQEEEDININDVIVNLREDLKGAELTHSIAGRHIQKISLLLGKLEAHFGTSKQLLKVASERLKKRIAKLRQKTEEPYSGDEPPARPDTSAASGAHSGEAGPEKSAGTTAEAQVPTIPAGLSPDLKQVLDDVLKKLGDKNPEDVKATFQYIAGIYGTFNKLLERTRQKEEPRYVFMPLPETLRKITSVADKKTMTNSIEKSLGQACEITKDILKANGFTNVNIEFYDGTLESLRNVISSTSAKKGNITVSNGLAYIDKDVLGKLTDDERKALGVTTVKENIPKSGGLMTVGGHVILALGVLDLFNNDRAADSEYWEYVLGLVRKISNNEFKYEGITKDEFVEKIKKGDLEIDLPPIERERIDENMRVLSITEKAVGTAM